MRSTMVRQSKIIAGVHQSLPSLISNIYFGPAPIICLLIPWCAWRQKGVAQTSLTESAERKRECRRGSATPQKRRNTLKQLPRLPHLPALPPTDACCTSVSVAVAVWRRAMGSVAIRGSLKEIDSRSALSH